jgi:hypothetical protein
MDGEYQVGRVTIKRVQFLHDIPVSSLGPGHGLLSISVTEEAVDTGIIEVRIISRRQEDNSACCQKAVMSRGRRAR